jgi:hypothetical protein
MLALDSPGLLRRPNKRPAQWAPVRMPLRCLAHYAVLHVKLLAARASMVNLPSLQLAGNSAFAKRATVNKLFGSDVSIFDLKSVSAHIAVIYSARAHGAAHSNLTERAIVLDWLCCSLLPKLLSWMWLRLHRADRSQCVELFLCT